MVHPPIPARLHIVGTGSVGHPAVILGLLLFGVWVISTLSPTIKAGARCWPVRLVLSIFWLACLLSYAVMNRHSMPADQLANSDRFLISMMVFSGLVLMTAEGVRRMEDVMRLARTLVAAIAVMCAIAILQSRAGLDLTTYIAKIPVLVLAIRRAATARECNVPRRGYEPLGPSAGRWHFSRREAALGWRQHRSGRRRRLRARPGTILSRANLALLGHGYRLGPDPASASACTLGGVIANNSSGMCCGTTQNSYKALSSLAFMLPSGHVHR